MDELKKIGKLTLERMEKEEKLNNYNSDLNYKAKEFRKRTETLRKLIKNFKSSVKDKQVEIDEEVIKLMKTFSHSRVINKKKKASLKTSEEYAGEEDK